MDKNLESYIKIYTDRIPVELREKTLEKIETCDWNQHKFYNSATDTYSALVGEAELDIAWIGENEITEELVKVTWGVVDSYIKDLQFPWIQTWDGFTPIRFNRYKEGREMDLHCDHIQSMFDGTRKGIPMLSIVGALNDDYEGGAFIMFEDTPIRLEAGSYLIFPSNFLYPHRVAPVTKGERNTFVSWVW